MIKKLNEIKHKKGKGPKVICDKIDTLKAKYQDHAEILDNDTIVMNVFLVCTKLCKSELMQAHIKAKVNGMDIMYKNLIMCMNVTWRIECCGKRVTQVEES